MTHSEERSLLVIVAHPDDECIGAGGTIISHASTGVSVDVLCLTGNKERNLELNHACKKLGVRNVYSSIRDDFAIDMSLTSDVSDVIIATRPEVVITHSYHDYNRNHSMCARIVDEAVEWASHTTMFESAYKVSRIYHMEINSLLTRPNIMVDISDHYEKALESLREHKSQVGKADGFYLKFYDARTRLRGVQSACSRAEAFSLIPTNHVGPFYPKNNVKTLL